jgi:hypothetical protein
MPEQFPEMHSVWKYFESLSPEIGARKTYVAQSPGINQKIVIILYRGIKADFLNAFLIPLDQYSICLDQKKDPFTDPSVTEIESFELAAGIVKYRRTSLVGCLATRSEVRTSYEECSHRNAAVSDDGLGRVENKLNSKLDGLEKLLKFAVELSDS